MKVNYFRFIVCLLLFGVTISAFSQSKNKITLTDALPSSNKKLEFIDHIYYKLGYDNSHKQAQWVGYLLTKTMVQNVSYKRNDDFREDNSVSKGSATLMDYFKSGYDRGHLCPSGDMTWSYEAMDMTFLLSNISPQEPDFNRGIWKYLEDRVRDWAVRNDSIIVITGPILSGITKRIGKNKVSVPKKFFKIIIDMSPPTIKAIGFVMPNESFLGETFKYSVTIDEVERLTGLNFFPQYEADSTIKNLEEKINISDWK